MELQRVFDSGHTAPLTCFAYNDWRRELYTGSQARAATSQVRRSSRGVLHSAQSVDPARGTNTMTRSLLQGRSGASFDAASRALARAGQHNPRL